MGDLQVTLAFFMLMVLPKSVLSAAGADLTLISTTAGIGDQTDGIYALQNVYSMTRNTSVAMHADGFKLGQTKDASVNFEAAWDAYALSDGQRLGELQKDYSFDRPHELGAILSSSIGQPLEDGVDKPLACFSSNAERSFFSFLDEHLAKGHLSVVHGTPNTSWQPSPGADPAPFNVNGFRCLVAHVAILLISIFCRTVAGYANVERGVPVSVEEAQGKALYVATCRRAACRSRSM
eukprot:TRINITY_DN56483_c0_g2_i2.p1 TRINITY_DN56483_c0_g2~~TRINITY_DN56483_c0_g2_i2.p1  ORF type:complete len:236 (+),score=35.67 TRINITY_DN56483_c0_g2_i2:211-918(+)